MCIKKTKLAQSCYLVTKWTGVEPATSPLRIRYPNHYITNIIKRVSRLLTRSMRTSYDSDTLLTGLDSEGSQPRFSHIDRTLDMWVSRKFTSRSCRYFSFDPQMYSNNWKVTIKNPEMYNGVLWQMYQKLNKISMFTDITNAKVSACTGLPPTVDLIRRCYSSVQFSSISSTVQQ